MHKIIAIISLYIRQGGWDLIELAVITGYVFLSRKKRWNGRVAAAIGFGLLAVALAFNLAHADMQAGIVAEFIWIFFAVSFVQELVHYLMHEKTGK